MKKNKAKSLIAKLKLAFVFGLIFSAPVFAECGYGTIESVRLDDGRGFRFAFLTQANSVNGCKIQNRTIVVNKAPYGNITDPQQVYSLALAAIMANKKIWISYEDSGTDGGANFLTGINLYSN